MAGGASNNRGSFAFLCEPLRPLRLTVSAILVLGGASAVAAQNPESDIFVADVLVEAGHTTEIGVPRNVTNRAGYDNHPWFSPDGTALYYVAELDGQTDVFSVDLTSLAVRRVTDTPENEFSPTLLPGGELLVVRWVADMSDGHLWLYSAAGRPRRAPAYDVSRVGYYAWADDRTLAVFVNDSVQSFVLADAVTGAQRRIGAGLNGSPPRRVPGQNAVSFMQQDAAGEWWIHKLELGTLEAAPYARVPEGAATNYFWTPTGELFMARGNELIAWAGEDEWRTVASFDEPGLGEIVRFALSPNGRRIALVGRPATEDPEE